MSKAILVLNNMPDKCKDCPLHEMSGSFDKHLCVPMQKSHDKFAKKKPDWCPLKDLPNHKENNFDDNRCKTGHVWGYNACLDEILGE